MTYVRKSNLQTSSNNLLQLAENGTGCCGETATPCKYYAQIDLEDVTAITYKDKDGANAVAAVVFTPGDAGDLATAIDTALRNAGMFTDQVIPHIQVAVADGTADDGTVSIEIFSNVELVNIISTSGTTAFDQHCDQTTACEYRFGLTAEDGMDVDITDTDEDTTASAINGDFGTPATDEGDYVDEVIAAFNTAYGAGTVKQVWAAYNDVTGMYDTRVWLYGRHHPVLGEVAADFYGCIRDFITEA